MRELLAARGLIHSSSRSSEPTSSLSFIEAADRRSQPLPGLFTVSIGDKPFYRRPRKRTILELKKFSESALPSRAIRLIRSSIMSLDYGIQPKQVAKQSGMTDETAAASIDKIRRVLDNPNTTDDDLPSFLGQIVEDLLVFDAGAWEYVPQPVNITGNDLLALEVVPGYSLAMNMRWDGSEKGIRWAQMTDDLRPNVYFPHHDIEYLMQRKRSWTPYGLSPLESAAEIMDAWLGVASYQRQVASDAYPGILIWLGENLSQPQRDQFRSYWETDLKGRGSPGFYGGSPKPEVLNLKAKNDSEIYLKYEEKLIRILAFCFDLKPMDFGLERDVNRNTAEVMQTASVAESRRPLAQLIQTKINQRVIPRIAEISGDKNINELEFFWTNIDPLDEKRQADILAIYADRDVLTIDEIRAERDLEPLPGGIGKLTKSGLLELYKIQPTLLIDETQFMAPALPTVPAAASRAGENGQGRLELIAAQSQKVIERLQQEIEELKSSLADLSRPSEAPHFDINVEPPSVTVNVEQPSVQVNPAEVNIGGAQVNVAPAPINAQFNLPGSESKPKTIKKIQRDADGNIESITEE